jgi:hypothetical protein
MSVCHTVNKIIQALTPVCVCVCVCCCCVMWFVIGSILCIPLLKKDIGFQLL